MAASTLLLRNVTEWTTSPRRRAVARPVLPKGRHNRFAPARAERRALESGDAAVVARVQAGDEAAADALVERLYPTVLRMVRSHLPRRATEEDLSQAVFAKIFKKLHQFSGLVPLEHWVARIAINTCLTQLQHEAIRPELRMSDLSEDQEAVVQQLARSDEDVPGESCADARELLEKLLARLKPDERLIITLRHLEDRSNEEISRLTGWSIPVVKVRAFRARHRMRMLWERLFKEAA